MRKVEVLVVILGMALLCVAVAGRGAESQQGRDFYLKFCASCHGIEGSGNGPVSKHLKIKPTDLTLLSKKNKGVFPLDQVMTSVDGTRVVRTHGEAKMPVWGEVFEKYDRAEKNPKQAQIKVKAIAEYISTLQR